MKLVMLTKILPVALQASWCFSSAHLVDLALDDIKCEFQQVMQPSLEDLQQALNKACQLIIDVSRGVYQWGQKVVDIMIHPSSAAETPIQMLPGLGKDKTMLVLGPDHN